MPRAIQNAPDATGDQGQEANRIGRLGKT